MGLLFLEWVVELLIFHYNIEKRMFVNQVITSLLTFAAILMLGGTIRAESEQGKGTLFCILLPVNRQAPIQEGIGRFNGASGSLWLNAFVHYPNPEDESDYWHTDFFSYGTLIMAKGK